MTALWRSLSAGLVIALGTRVLLAGLGVAALIVPLPALTGHPAAGVAALALPVPFIIAWRPGSGWVTVLLVDAVLAWVVASLVEGLPPLGLTIGFGCLLYLVHATAAFADGLPVTKRVEPVLVIHSTLRLLGVLAASVPLMVAVLLLPEVPGSAPLALAGVASTLGVAVMLALLARRRPAG